MTLAMVDKTLEDTIDILSKRINDLLVKFSLYPDRRVMIAFAGVPGSGKSTVSSKLLKRLPQKAIDNVVVVPMDGFHFPKKTLAKFPCPETAFRRRGAPFTFDADAFVEIVTALKKGPVTQEDDPRLAIRLPSFDHAIQDPVDDDIYVPSSARVIIVEGNYLLFDESPWNKTSAMFDERWFVDVPPQIAKRRLIERDVHAGIETSREAAAARVEENDLQNGAVIRSKLIRPDVTFIN
ncbi:uncharacterized protein Z520_09012 [Fonsecaea multimorphosa CBS 102226]|uniref:Phosphoribulokinase/uridine kinase domain-containing protein n=1 Tax=Fonsecaea multimorphosa CBS 102226 TaxID=1442371 RepID=A0A0D2ID84_9EURO|nr:uncharacterized protein Z520_09012 [Fonsecaea multimorphosa CBS 102226]KIX95096.1 hypothetical protein Z520_09012 [Fonsecaea multimorphosa CBS 102226]OAL20818.1 hypothetical protein AYO22_08446 [Fonsecaea multimorphosa]